MATERIQNIAQTVYDYLKRDCVGKQICISDAVANAYQGKDIPIQSDDDLWEIDEALYRLVSRKRQYVLDPGENRDCVLGLPFYCPFYFRPRGAKSPAWKIRIPYFNSGEEYFAWLSDIPAGSIPFAYERYFHGLKAATVHHGFEHPISEKKMMKALKRSQRTGQMISVVPDDEFLPGGTSEGQYDGWTYHLEFLPMREYFSQEYDSMKELGFKLPPKEEWVEQLVNEPNYMDETESF